MYDLLEWVLFVDYLNDKVQCFSSLNHFDNGEHAPDGKAYSIGPPEFKSINGIPLKIALNLLLSHVISIKPNDMKHFSEFDI